MGVCCHLSFAILVAAGLLDPSITRGQSHDAAGPQVRVEPFRIGATLGIGLPGPFGAIRASIPVNWRVSLDLDAGRFKDHRPVRTFYAAQVRVRFHPLIGNRPSSYFLAGAMLAAPASFPWPQLGLGWDWPWKDGARIGMEITNVQVMKVFVVWGRTSR